MRELNEQEISEWVRTPGNRAHKYRINAQGLGYLSMFGAVFLSISLILWVQSSLDREILFSVIIVIAMLNVFIWYRVASSLWFVSRNAVGLSDTELLIVKGYTGTLIPLKSIHPSDIGWNDGKNKSTGTSLPIKVNGQRFNIRLLSLYYTIEDFPIFMGGLLEHLSDEAVTPKDAI